MARVVDAIQELIPGAQGRMLGALLRLDSPRTISEVARLADVSRDRASEIVSLLEQLGVVERRPAGRAHLVSLIEEHPISRSLRDIEHTRDRAIAALQQGAATIDPSPLYMAIYGSWARDEITADSDIDIAVIADPSTDHDTLLAALERWSLLSQRITGRRPSLLIAERPAATRGPVWKSVRRDGIVLLDRGEAADGS